MRERHPEIEWIALFGSLARGDAVPGSDADLLIVVSHSSESFLQRAVGYRPADVGVSVDVVAYTREELAALLKTGNAFVRQALREGMVLVGDPDHCGKGGGCTRSLVCSRVDDRASYLQPQASAAFVV